MTKIEFPDQDAKNNENNGIEDENKTFSDVIKEIGDEETIERSKDLYQKYKLEVFVAALFFIGIFAGLLHPQIGGIFIGLVGGVCLSEAFIKLFKKSLSAYQKGKKVESVSAFGLCLSAFVFVPYIAFALVIAVAFRYVLQPSKHRT